MNNHTTAVLTILLFCVVMMTIRMMNRENYRNVRVTHAIIPKRVFSKSFNIDHHLKCEPQNLGWKGFWRHNYAQFSKNLDQVFSNKNNKTLPPLLFDGVRNTESCPL